MGVDRKGGFQYIEEYTGLVSPGILTRFLMGFFWRPATANLTMFATVGGLVGSIVFKILPGFLNLSFLAPPGFAVRNAAGVHEVTFLDRMCFVFVAVIIGMVVISKLWSKAGLEKAKGVEGEAGMFKVEPGFAVGATTICIALVAIYAAW